MIFEDYMKKSNECWHKAQEARKVNDLDMVLFWNSARLGYKIKAWNTVRIDKEF